MKNINTPKKRINIAKVVIPNNQQDFKCTGSQCEDNCCFGWQIDFDRATWEKYQHCNDPELKPIFEKNLPKPERDQKFVRLLKSEDGACPFLSEHKLCSIQQRLGEKYLSNICALFPRVFNQINNQLEINLTLACPEVARLTLLSSTPIKLKPLQTTMNHRNEICRSVFMDTTADSPVFKMILSLRQTMLNLLQFRALSIGARLTLLGCFLHEIELQNKNVPGILRVIQLFEAVFSDPEAAESQYQNLQGDLLKKLAIITSFLANYQSDSSERLRECMCAALDGWDITKDESHTPLYEQLTQNYLRNYHTYYQTYFSERTYIIENYLVSHVLSTMFPFYRENYLEAFRELVCNYVFIQTILVGMSGHYKGLTDEKVVQLIQSFTRTTAHNPTYLNKLNQDIGQQQGQHSLLDIIWLIKEF